MASRYEGFFFENMDRRSREVSKHASTHESTDGKPSTDEGRLEGSADSRRHPYKYTPGKQGSKKGGFSVECEGHWEEEEEGWLT